MKQPWRIWVNTLHQFTISQLLTKTKPSMHDDIIKWKHFLSYWPFVWGIHRSQVNSPHKGQWHGALMFSLICAWINGWVNNREAGDLRRHGVHYDVIVLDKIQCISFMVCSNCISSLCSLLSAIKKLHCPTNEVGGTLSRNNIKSWLCLWNLILIW